VTQLARPGCELHWDEQGDGSPVLLIMGALFSSRMWFPTLPSLTRHHRAVWFDNRGTGQSTGTEVASIEEMAADAQAVMDAAGLDTAHVYGISLGGVVALELAKRIPERVRSLVLGCTCVLTRDKPRAPVEINEVLATARREDYVASTVYGSACPPEAKERQARELLADTADPVSLVAQQNALRAYAADLDDVRALTMPSLVLHGDEDLIVPVEWGRELAATLPRSALVVYGGTGPLYPVERGDRANEDVLAFLAGVDAEAARQPVRAE
jgi:pimeloyl-ACP methyl ester carboxylesterase